LPQSIFWGTKGEFDGRGKGHSFIQFIQSTTKILAEMKRIVKRREDGKGMNIFGRKIKKKKKNIDELEWK
jgi:hypothetical protein